jgi:hypothetical protein
MRLTLLGLVAALFLACALQTSGLPSAGGGAGGASTTTSPTGGASSTGSSTSSSSTSSASSTGASSSTSSTGSTSSSSTSSTSSTSSSSSASSCGAGTTAELAGTLAGNAPGSDWMISPVNQVTVTQNAGVVTFASDGTGGKVSTYSTTRPFSIQGCSLAVQVSAAPTGTTVEGAFQIADPNDASTHVGITELSGTLSFVERQGGNITDSAMVPYDANMHLHWRMREAGGTLHYETSPDGSAWTVQHTVATPSYAGGGTIILAVGAVSHTSAGSFAFSDLQ